MATATEDVYCTLLMSDSYLPGAAVLSHSLRDAGTKKKLACMVTLDTLSSDTISELKTLYDYLIPVDRIANPNPANLYAMQRPDLLFAFTKIALWRQTQFRKIVYIDADIVALRAPDELFDIDAPFAAAPDIGWPDAFNSGLMVITPNMGDYWALQTLAASGDSFDGADQGLLNQYYEHRGWERISFTYNCTPNAEYQWEPAYKYYKSRISMVHFIGKDKPWTKGRHVRGPGIYSDLLSRWWAVHDRHLKPVFTPGEPVPAPSAAERYVEGESLGFIPHPEDAIRAAPPVQPGPPPEAPPTSTEQPFTEPGERAENIDQGIEEPVPTVQQRKFSAPQAEWDATRFAPPVESRPEAFNFPSDVYEFSQSRELFQAPTSYPEPPKDMWFEVPKTRPTPQVAPKPIFPWERERGPQKPTRIFAEDLPPEPEPEVGTPTLMLTPTRGEGDSRSTTPTAQEIVQEDPIRQEPFSPTPNVWDNVAGIERYVRAVLGAQTKAKPTIPAGLGGMGVLSPTGQGAPAEGTRGDREKRRESLIITDFPSAVERPSLPVTPAPIRRPTFWGDEGGASGEGKEGTREALPVAEGVPDQIDWVCPSCGFVAESPVAFARPRRAAEQGKGKDEKAKAELVKQVLELEFEPGIKPRVEDAQEPQLESGPSLETGPIQEQSGEKKQPDVPPVSTTVVEGTFEALPPAPPVDKRQQRHSSSADSNFSIASTVVGPSITATAGGPLEDAPKAAPAPLPPPPESTGPFWFPSYAPLRSEPKEGTTMPFAPIVAVPEEAVLETPAPAEEEVEPVMRGT